MRWLFAFIFNARGWRWTTFQLTFYTTFIMCFSHANSSIQSRNKCFSCLVLTPCWTMILQHRWVNPLSANPAKWSDHLKYSSAVAHKLFECVWPFCGVGDWRVKWLLPVEIWLFKFNSKYTKTTSKDFILTS